MKETLEEASEYFAHNNFNMHNTNNYKALKVGFEEGAKWQQERMYSEEEVYSLLCSMPNFYNMTIPQQVEARDKWFEQFKKK